MTVNSRAVQGIVGTLEMTVLVIRMICPVQWIEVQATDETHVFCHQILAMHITYMRLGDGIAALFT